MRFGGRWRAGRIDPGHVRFRCCTSHQENNFVADPLVYKEYIPGLCLFLYFRTPIEQCLIGRRLTFYQWADLFLISYESAAVCLSITCVEPLRKVGKACFLLNVHRKALLDESQGLYIGHLPPMLPRNRGQSLTLDVTPTGFFSIQGCCRSTSRASSKSELIVSDIHPRNCWNIPSDSFSYWSELPAASAAPAFIISAVALIPSMMCGFCQVSVSFAALYGISGSIGPHSISWALP